MTLKYFTASNTGVGFITHEDQELDGLVFQICATDAGESLIKSDYLDKDTDKAIKDWKKRVNGTDMSPEEAQTWGENAWPATIWVPGDEVGSPELEFVEVPNVPFNLDDYVIFKKPKKPKK